MVAFLQNQDDKHGQIKSFLPKNHLLKQQDDEPKFEYFHTSVDFK